MLYSEFTCLTGNIDIVCARTAEYVIFIYFKFSFGFLLNELVCLNLKFHFLGHWLVYIGVYIDY